MLVENPPTELTQAEELIVGEMGFPSLFIDYDYPDEVCSQKSRNFISTSPCYDLTQGEEVVLVDYDTP